MRDFIRVFWPYVSRYRWLVVFGYVTSLVSAGVGLSIGLIINARLDSVIADPNLLDELARFVLLIVGMVFVNAVASFLHSYSMSWVGAHIVRDVRRSLFAKMLGHGEQLVVEESSGELQTRVVADTTALGEFLGGQLPSLFVTAISLVGGVSAAIYVSPLLSGAVVGGLAVLAVPMLLVSPLLRSRGERTQQAEAEAGRSVGEALRNAPMVHAFNQLRRERYRFDVASGKVTRYFLSALRLSKAVNVPINAGASTLLILVLWLGVHQIAIGELSLGQLTAFGYYMVFVINAAFSVVSLVTGVNVIIGRTKKIIGFLNLPDLPRMEGREVLEAPLRIEFKDLHYRYPSREEDALTGIQLVIKPNRLVAFMGASGSGKTTLFKMLLRLVDPTAGQLLGNGIQAHRYPVAAWRSQFGFVPQSDYLVSGSVADNISYGVENASLEAIEQAARAAFAHDFVAALPDGYDTDLGEVGARLSGGQKQRISLARAILTKPSIYLLDEPTSALDAESERAVEHALKQLAQSATVLVITHRLSTAKTADLVVVMQDGRMLILGLTRCCTRSNRSTDG